MSDIEAVAAERVDLVHQQIWTARVELAGRPDYLDSEGRLGKKGQSWCPTQLRVDWQKTGDDPWRIVDAKVLLNLRLKSGGLSGSVERSVALYDDDGSSPYRSGWPWIIVPDYVPGMVEAYAPGGWTAG